MAFADLRFIVCPKCGNRLVREENKIACSSCHKKFRVDKGIPLLFYSNEWEKSKEDVTELIKSFYEETPFPNYEDLDSAASLRDKATKGVFARLLDEQIPQHTTVLEAGCGTGQLSNFLGMTWGRRIYGTDMCLNSLKMANEFKDNNNIGSVSFVQMNLFQPVFNEESLDIVICNGVLHHTSDPFMGFQSLSKLVKKGGYIIIGLYHMYGRIPTDIKRVIFNISDNRFKFLDTRIRDKSVGKVRKNTWFEDQYKNPHESKHTIGEVLKWFDKTGFSYISSIPSSSFLHSFSNDEKLFDTHPQGNKLENLFVDLSMFATGTQEGGFFIMIGRKNYK